MMEQDTWRELLELAGDQANGNADDASIARLEELLQDEAARQEYLKYMFLHAELSQMEGLADQKIPGAEQNKKSSATPPDMTPVLRNDSESSSLFSAFSLYHWGGGLFAALCVAIIAVSLFSRRQGDDVELSVVDARESYYRHDVDNPQGVLATLQHSAATEWVGAEATSDTKQELPRGTLRLHEGEAKLKFQSGTEVTLVGHTVIGLEKSDHAALLTGKLSTKIAQQDTQFVVETPDLRVVDRGTEFSITVQQGGNTEVEVLEGEIELFRRTRSPVRYWSFDEDGTSVADAVTGEEAQVSKDIKRVEGLIGNGALKFDNRFSNYVSVGNGGGTKPGTGAFSATTGISIEALLVPGWSGVGYSHGQRSDYDEIFRKEDGDYRILLSFQNDHGTIVNTLPQVDLGPCLSFGLHLAGLGYSELDMPLDGKDGRPTLDELKDNRTHHIVAVYDAKSGRKAIYVDGKLRYQYRFPMGSMIISGGPKPAVIGNVHIPPDRSCEPFTGIIDEVAFYDFALTAKEVKKHYDHVRSGKNYFGQTDGKVQVTFSWSPLAKLKAGQAMLVDIDQASVHLP